MLSDDEIRWLWTATAASGELIRPIGQVLLLTAQRRDEVASMEWSEIDFVKSLWSIPAEKSKNGHEHLVPLSSAALGVLEILPRVVRGLVFTTTGRTPVSGFSRAKRRLDREMETARRSWLNLPQSNSEYRRAVGISAERPLPVGIPPWIIHDLRRTAATGMARLETPPHSRQGAQPPKR